MFDLNAPMTLQWDQRSNSMVRIKTDPETLPPAKMAPSQVARPVQRPLETGQEEAAG